MPTWGVFDPGIPASYHFRKEGAYMPLSFAALQIYDQYLTSYRSGRDSRYDIHSNDTLKKLYSAIQWTDRFHPAYMSEPSSDDIYTAVSLKEQACSFKHSLSSIKEENLQHLFAKKISYSSEPDLVTVSFDDENGQEAPTSFHVKVHQFATPQKNIGNFLNSDQYVILPEETYSFDVSINQKNYELQFRIDNNMTHKALQNKLVRLINHSDIGIHASLLEDSSNASRNALLLTSDSIGKKRNDTLFFKISDDNTSMKNGIVNYLGLNREIIPPDDLIYEIDEEVFSSYINEIDVFNSYHLTFHPEKTVYNCIEQPVTIGVYPDIESMEQNIKTYVNSYNQFITTMSQISRVKELYNNFRKFTNIHRNNLVDYGITVQSDYTLCYGKINQSKFQDTQNDPLADLQHYGSKIESMIDEVIMDPMKYLNRRICSYKNPQIQYINPYETSIYTGLLFQSYI